MSKEHACPICNGKGVTKVPIHVKDFYPGKVSLYGKMNSAGETKYRIRIEIPRKYHEAFLETFGKGDEVAIFMMNLVDYVKIADVDELSEELDGE